MCGDHGSEPMRLWMWHLAEEFEHRSVVHDVLHRLFGPEEAFRLRTEGATFNRRHNAEHVLAAAVHITGIDQAGMADEEREASDQRALEAAAAVAALSAEAREWVYQPDYDPSAVAPPRHYERLLDSHPRAQVAPVDRPVHHAGRPARRSPGRFSRRSCRFGVVRRVMVVPAVVAGAEGEELR